MVMSFVRHPEGASIEDISSKCHKSLAVTRFVSVLQISKAEMGTALSLLRHQLGKDIRCSQNCSRTVCINLTEFYAPPLQISKAELGTAMSFLRDQLGEDELRHLLEQLSNFNDKCVVPPL